MGAAFDFFADGVRLGWELVAGDREGFVQCCEVGEDDGAGVVFGLVSDGKGAAQHGGEAALEFVSGGKVSGGVARDYDFVGQCGVVGGHGGGEAGSSEAT